MLMVLGRIIEQVNANNVPQIHTLYFISGLYLNVQLLETWFSWNFYVFCLYFILLLAYDILDLVVRYILI